MSDFELIIVGGGLASARAIRAYREAGGEGTIALVSADSTIPYHRPPLSKRYLRGEAEQADTLVEPHAFYNGNGIELLLETEVASIDPGKHTITTRDGHDYRSRKLLLATGAVPRQLDVDGAELPGVFTLRSLSDSTAIREAAAETRDAVVVGSGFIGMEVAASLSELELDVTLVSRDVDLFSQLGSPEISERLVTLYGERGVDVLRGDEVRAFRGHSRLDTVELHSGPAVGAGLAVVGVGVQPAVSFLEGRGSSSTTGSSSTRGMRRTRPASTPPVTSRPSSIRSSAGGGASSTGRTPTTRAPRSGGSSPAPTAATTPSRPSSPNRSD